MDTNTKVMMRLMDELYGSENGEISGQYTKYYESLSNDTAKAVVQDAIRKIVGDGTNTICELGETEFKLKLN